MRLHHHSSLSFFFSGENCVINHLSLDQLTVGSSILFTTTSSLETPKVFASWTCSRVWPPFSYPVSNSPFRAEITCEQDRERLINNQQNKWQCESYNTILPAHLYQPGMPHWSCWGHNFYGPKEQRSLKKHYEREKWRENDYLQVNAHENVKHSLHA